MRLYLFLLFTFCTVIVSAQSKTANEKDETAIRNLLAKQTNAWNDGDLPRFMETYWKSDSLMFVGKTGITYGWENTLLNYEKGYPDTIAMGKLSFDILVVKRISKEYFQVIGKWHLKRSIGDLSGHYTLLLKKINGTWLIVSDHSS